MIKIIFAGLIAFGLVTGCNNKEASKETAGKTQTETTTEKNAPKKIILFFGNSLTAGYGLEPAQAFPALIQHRIDSLGLNYTSVNAGVSGETSSGGKGRIDWILKTPVDVFVLELGANDGLRGIPVTETHKNLQAIIDAVKTKYPQAKLVLAGMQVPPNMGAKYSTDFRTAYIELAKNNNMALIPFLLEGVGGVRSLNQQDGIHPNVEGAKIVADNVWKILKGLM